VVHAGVDAAILKFICGVCCQRCNVWLSCTSWSLLDEITDGLSRLKSIHDWHVAIHENKSVVVSTLLATTTNFLIPRLFSIDNSLERNLTVERTVRLHEQVMSTVDVMFEFIFNDSLGCDYIENVIVNYQHLRSLCAWALE